MSDFATTLRAKMEDEAAGDPFGRSNIEYFLGNRAEAILALVEAAEEHRFARGMHKVNEALCVLDGDDGRAIKLPEA